MPYAAAVALSLCCAVAGKDVLEDRESEIAKLPVPVKPNFNSGLLTAEDAAAVMKAAKDATKASQEGRLKMMQDQRREMLRDERNQAEEDMKSKLFGTQSRNFKMK